MTPDKEQTMGGEERDWQAEYEAWHSIARDMTLTLVEAMPDYTYDGYERRLAEEAARRLRRGGEVEMHGEIRKKPWRWRVCAECHYSDWALDADYRVCNDCGSPRVTDYVPTDPAPTSEKEREPTDMIADRALQKVVEEGWSDEQYHRMYISCDECGDRFLTEAVHKIDCPGCGHDDALIYPTRSTPDGSEGRVYPRLTCAECHTTSGGDELDCALCPNCGGHTFTVEPGDHE